MGKLEDAKRMNELLKANQQKLAEAEVTKVNVVDVIRHNDTAISIPVNMTVFEVIDTLIERARYEEQFVDITETFDAFLWDGANALSLAMEKLYGWSRAVVIPGGFFEPDQPPALIAVETEVGKTVNVPWGRFMLPGVEGYIQTDSTKKDGRYVFQFKAHVRRKYEHAVKSLANLTRQFLATHSVYRGKAFRIRFKNEEGETLPLPEPKFIDLSHVREEELIFSRDVEEMVNHNLFTPIEKIEQCRKAQVPLKRGVGLAGDFGVGKTLAGYIAALKATRNNVTFVLCPRADEITDVLRFAMQYQPAVVMCEDIDRVLDGERDVQMDDILNAMDGVDTKNSEIITIFTTNKLDSINQAMLRPGRLDAVIPVTRPDSEAVQRLIRLYGRELVPQEEDLTEVGNILQDNIPAVIRECVERAKLSAIALSDSDGEFKLSARALVASAKSMKKQLELLTPRPEDKRTPFEALGDAIGTHIAIALMREKDQGRDINELTREETAAD